MAQPLHASSPGACEWRHLENRSARRSCQLDWLQRWSFFERKACLDGSANAVRRQMEVLAGFLQTLVKLRDAFLELPLCADKSPRLRRPRLCFACIELTSAAFDQSRHLWRND